jgi:general transcription factor 3C polypeptide 3 (transcription factor C subunit 4)
MHTAVILAHNIMDYASLYLEIADAYFEKEMYAEARPVYEALGADASVRALSSIFPVPAYSGTVD